MFIMTIQEEFTITHAIEKIKALKQILDENMIAIDIANYPTLTAYLKADACISACGLTIPSRFKTELFKHGYIIVGATYNVIKYIRETLAPDFNYVVEQIE